MKHRAKNEAHSTPPLARLLWRMGWGVLVLGLVVGWQFRFALGTQSSPRVVLSGVYFDGYLKGSPEPEESIRLTNMSKSRAVDVSGWVISDRYFLMSRRTKGSRSKRWKRHSVRRIGRSSRRGRWSHRRKRRAFNDDPDDPQGSDDDDLSSVDGESYPTGSGNRLPHRDIILPSGSVIPAGGSIWVAHKAKAFRMVFGFLPQVEGIDTSSKVPNARLPAGWPHFFASRGIVSLHDAYGQTVDVVCYVRDSDSDELDRSKVPREHWVGPSVMLRHANTYSWKGQILARDRDLTGHPVPDTNSARDWDNSFSKKRLGQDHTHRVELPGQSHWRFPKLFGVQAEVLATSAPENNYAALSQAFRRARREILINIYQFTGDLLADAVVDALKRGVKVKVLMEGSPVGGVKDRSRAIAQRLVRAGATVLWMRALRKQRIFRRYRFNHAKYALIDRTWAIIGSENYGTTGHPVDPSYGNRGWEIHIRSPQLVSQLLRVFQVDTDVQRYRDLVAYRDETGSRWGAPKPSFRPKREIKRGRYTYRRAPLRVRGRVDLELVLSPDNSLDEKGSLIGSILRCKREVLAIQNSIPLYWGKKNRRSFATTQNLALSALIQAAKKGCRVRVLIDSVWYHIRNADPRDNDDTVRVLNNIARKYKLDLQAKLINLDAANLSKIHTKGLIIDREQVFVGSINWSENSFKGNREVGVLIRHPKVAQYYTDLFMRDWIRSRIFQVVMHQDRIRAYAQPSARSRILRSFSSGDPIDVLGVVGDFYQVRLHERLLGYMPKSGQMQVFTPYEARFLVGQHGVVVGKVKQIRFRGKLTQIHFAQAFQRGFAVILWDRTTTQMRDKYGDLRRAWVGRYIQVRGKITAYRNNPQMLLREPEQLTILH